MTRLAPLLQGIAFCSSGASRVRGRCGVQANTATALICAQARKPATTPNWSAE